MTHDYHQIAMDSSQKNKPSPCHIALFISLQFSTFVVPISIAQAEEVVDESMTVYGERIH